MPAGLTSRWGWYWVRGFPDPGRAPKCKTQNSGLRSKEEKPRDPISQPIRCNTQEGLLSFAQTGDSELLGGRAHRTANWASFICNMLHTGCKVTGYMFAKQSYWYKLRPGFCSNLKQFYWCKRRGLFSNLGAHALLSSLAGFLLGAHWLAAPGHLMGAGNPTISRKTKPKSWPPAGPGPLPALAPCQPQPQQPHIIKLFFSASKTNKKNIRHMNYRHW